MIKYCQMNSVFFNCQNAAQTTTIFLKPFNINYSIILDAIGDYYILVKKYLFTLVVLHVVYF